MNITQKRAFSGRFNHFRYSKIKSGDCDIVKNYFMWLPNDIINGLSYSQYPMFEI